VRLTGRSCCAVLYCTWQRNFNNSVTLINGTTVSTSFCLLSFPMNNTLNIPQTERVALLVVCSCQFSCKPCGEGWSVTRSYLIFFYQCECVSCEWGKTRECDVASEPIATVAVIVRRGGRKRFTEAQAQANSFHRFLFPLLISSPTSFLQVLRTSTSAVS
jgi:hypothetical protein